MPKKPKHKKKAETVTGRWEGIPVAVPVFVGRGPCGPGPGRGPGGPGPGPGGPGGSGGAAGSAGGAGGK